MQKFILLLILTVMIASCGQPVSKNTTDQKVDSLLALMTLEEKIGQLTLYTSGWDVTGPTMNEN